MKIVYKKDGSGFLAEVEWVDYLFAYWNTKEEAKNELSNVIDMVMDYHLEQVEIERKAKNKLLEDNVQFHAV